MTDLLLERIKELEEELEISSKKINSTKEEIIQQYKESKINKNKKNEFKKKFKEAIEKININMPDKFFENNFLKYDAFIKIIENLNGGYLNLNRW